jgi:transcriptional regulator with XRE-family HTH domain
MAKNHKKAVQKAGPVGRIEPPEPTGDPIFAANLRRLLDAQGMPARELARRIEISPQAISQWLSQQTAPTTRRLVQIAGVFGVHVERLRQDTGARNIAHLRQLESQLSSDAQGQPKLDEHRATLGLWMVPAEVISAPDPQADVAIVTVRDNALEPDLRAGDYVFADVGCRTVVAPGIYLLLIAGAPAWRRCHPLVGDKVQVADREVKQEVAVKELVVLGRAIRLLTQP